jgi:hypothetical protein
MGAYAAAVTDLNATEESKPPKGSRIRIYVAAAVAALLVVGGTTAYLVHSLGGTELRFEVETASGGAHQIAWHIGPEQRGLFNRTSMTKLVPTPWSATVTADDYPGDGGTFLVARSSATDELTCRIIVDGKVVSEATKVQFVGCSVGTK